MAHPLIDRAFYEAILRFEESEEAQETYYRIMDTAVERNGRTYTVRGHILRAYAMLFCDDIGAVAGQLASPEDVEAGVLDPDPPQAPRSPTTIMAARRRAKNFFMDFPPKKFLQIALLYG